VILRFQIAEFRFQIALRNLREQQRQHGIGGEHAARVVAAERHDLGLVVRAERVVEDR
jgi:hypothetical protein